MLVVLHGARRNAGDFLIRDRGVQLIRMARPDVEIKLHERWRPLPESVSAAAGIVLCGGPSLQPDVYPGVYPLVPDLQSLRTPATLLALGWSGEPVGAPEAFAFTERSRAALRALVPEPRWAAARDDVSADVLRSAGIAVRTSGCTAWYSLDDLGHRFDPPPSVRRVVVTTPARFAHGRQAFQLLAAVAKRFPNAERACAFHRGLARRDTPLQHWLLNNAIAARARSLGFRVLDLAGSPDGLQIYRDVDLHVGYRVHAHLCTLSHRRPSLLIAEDGRGEGQMVTLGDPYALLARHDDVVLRTGAAIDAETSGGWEGTRRAIDTIERTFPIMREALEQLPR